MTTDGTDIVRSIKRTLHVLVGLTAVLFVLLALLGVKAYHDANVSTGALCALRSDLEKRVESSRAFLLEHPDGIIGISPKTIQDGITNQERTISALSGIAC
jgi:hypothetical protein